MIFSNKYRRRIEIARLKAIIKLREIEREQVDCDIDTMIELIGIKGHMNHIISILDALLKGKEIRF